MILLKIYAAQALAPYTLKFSKHQEAYDFIDDVASKGVAQHGLDTFRKAKTFERWEASGYNPERFAFCQRLDS